MQPEFWHERWARNEIGFHRVEVHDLLNAHLKDLGLARGKRVFVPLCGKSLDMPHLRATGAEVLGVELSAIAVRTFFAEQGIAVTEGGRGPLPHLTGGGYDIMVGDFFAVTPEDLAGVSACYDRAALIALPPDMRRRYAEHMAALLPARTRTLLITHEYPAGEMDGPPFSVTEADVQGLFGRHFDIALRERRDMLGDEPRLRARGLTALAECAYLLTRR